MSYREYTAADNYPLTLNSKQLADPYKAFEDFYSADRVNGWRKYLRRVFKAAYRKRYSWHKFLPGNAVFCMGELQKLIEGAWLLYERKQSGAGDVSETLTKKDLNDPFNDSITAYYLGNDAFQTAWHFFPRHLSRAEFIRPYKVVKRFFHFQKLPEWRDDLADFLQCALSKTTIVENHDATRLYQVTEHLLKLIEAVHLIYIRQQTGEGKKKKEQ